jgi:hypothetical protein
VPSTLSTADDSYEIELRANRTWQPRAEHDERELRDDREISIAVCNLLWS